jgi:peptidoglycan/LPS O-acetylase OafA/YrhL
MIKYRTEIDGLRGLAVLAVILFHTDPNFFSGGYVGVDVFFVISGYLITSIIISDLEKNQFLLTEFYLRRARRILPALFLVILLSMPLAVMLFSTLNLENFSYSIISVIFLASNFFFWKDNGGGYFDLATNLKPLIHTWSISVEEQFYLLFPIFLIFLWKIKFNKKSILIIVAILTFISFILSKKLSSTNFAFNFFLLPTRGWELGLGCLISLMKACYPKISFSNRVNEIFSLAGLFFLSLSFFIFDGKTTYSSSAILLSTIGTLMIIYFATNETLVNKLLKIRILVFIGLISYGAYLFHQPILVFFRYYYTSINFTIKATGILITFLLAYLSWVLFEINFKKKKIISDKFFYKIISFFFFIILLINITIVFFLNKIANFNTETRMARILSNFTTVNVPININDRELVKKRIYYEKNNPDVIILGSSRAMQITNNIYPFNILNLSVPGASMEDYLAISYLSLNKFNPSTIIIGGDPWLFNTNSGQNRWKFFRDEYYSSLDYFSIQSENFSNKGKLKLQKSENNYEGTSSFFLKLGKIYEKINLFQLESNNDLPDLFSKIRPDGSRVVNVETERLKANEIFNSFDSNKVYGMSNYSFSANNKLIFEKFISELAKKYNVIIVLSPYHPKLYQEMKNEKNIIVDIEKDFMNFEKKITIVGSYDPLKLGCEDKDFYDGLHPKSSCMEKIFLSLNILK